MSYQVIDIGSAPNAKDGDTARTAFRKINENFAVVFGSPGAIIVNQTADFSAQAYTTYLVDTTLASLTATLPAAPNVGDVIRFIDSTGKFGTNNFLIDFNGKNLLGNVLVTKTYDTNFKVVELFFAGNSVGWIER